MVSEYIFADCKGNGYCLVLHVTVSIYILKIFERGIPRCFDHIKEIFKSSFAKGCNLCCNSRIITEEMHSPKHRTVSKLLAECRDRCKKFFFIYVTENFFSKICCNSFHIRRNLCIIRCQILMRTFGIYDAQTACMIFKIYIYFFYNRSLWIFEINVDQSTNRAGCLVHQTTWLSKVNIFRILTNLCNLYHADLHIVVKSGNNGSNDCFKCSRRGKSCSDQHITCHISIESTNLVSAFFQSCKYATDQSDRCPFFFVNLFYIIRIDNDHIISFRYHTDSHIFIFIYNCDRIQINRGCKHHSVLMICMISTNFTSSRCAVYFHFSVPIQFLILCHRFYIAFFLMCNHTFININIF